MSYFLTRPNRLAIQGVVLILAISILLLLAFFGVFFVVLGTTDVQVSSQALLSLRARLAAVSGVERERIELKESFFSGALWGPHSALAPENKRGPDQTVHFSIPVLQEARKTHELPTVLSFEGGHTLTFSVEVTDEQSKINVNQEWGASAPSGIQPALASELQSPLERVLNHLGTLLGIERLGDRLLAHRPPQGYEDLTALQRVLTPSEWARVKNYLTVYSNMNEKAVRPVPLEDRQGYAPAGAEESTLYPPLRLGQARSFVAWSQLEPISIETEGRAPVNINTALKPVLVALLWGLQGFYVDAVQGESISAYRPQNVVPGQAYVPRPFPLGTLWLSPPISKDQAGQIADRIIERRQQRWFLSWPDFYDFCDGLAQEGVITAAQADVLKANFNPNLDVNFRNPNAALYKSVDKLSLTVSSMEFCFLPRGTFTIRSRGEVFQGSPPLRAKSLAQAIVQEVVRLFYPLDVTTEKDFLGPDPASLARRMRPADPEVLKSTAHHLPLDFYPEPFWSGKSETLESPARKFLDLSAYDGAMLLSTLTDPIFSEGSKEKKPEEAPWRRQVSLYTSFNKTLEAGEPEAGKKQVLHPALPDQAGYPRLFVDGAYSELGRTLRYKSEDVFHSQKDPPESGPSNPSGQAPHLGPAASSPAHLLRLYRGNEPPETESSTGSKPCSYPPGQAVQAPEAPVQVYFPAQLSGHIPITRYHLLIMMKKINPPHLYTDGDLQEQSSYKLDDLFCSPSLAFFMPHSCYKWDIYFMVNSYVQTSVEKKWTGKEELVGIHFPVKEQDLSLLKTYYTPEAYEKLYMLCHEEEPPPSTPVPPPSGIKSLAGAVAFWIKPAWGNLSAGGHVLYAMGRSGKSVLDYLHQRGIHVPLTMYFVHLASDGTAYTNPWGSWGVQEGYAAWVPPHFVEHPPWRDAAGPDIPSLTFVLEGGLDFEKRTKPRLQVFYPLSLKPHEWYHVILGWDTRQTSIEKAFRLILNGKELSPWGVQTKEKASGNSSEPPLAGSSGEKGSSPSPSPKPVLETVEDITQPEWPGLRFGELLRRPYAALDQDRNDPWAWGFTSADATYDELYVFHSVPDEQTAQALYGPGRYYSGAEISYQSPEISLQGASRLYYVGATIWNARDWTISIDVSGPTAPDRSGQGKSLPQRLALNEPLPGLATFFKEPIPFSGGSLTYRLLFQRRSTLQGAWYPLLDSPVVDDLTFYFGLPTPHILETHWE